LQAAYREARRVVVQHAIVQVQRAIGATVETFRTVMQDADASASARVSAAKTVLETGSAATVTDTLVASNNRVFGINVNGSAITFSLASVSANNNALGIQIATSANAFISDATTVINVQHNLSTGLTVVSGAHLVSFGGTINASGNPSNGVSVNAKGGFDPQQLQQRAWCSPPGSLRDDGV
jgi:hypothetical protein